MSPPATAEEQTQPETPGDRPFAPFRRFDILNSFSNLPGGFQSEKTDLRALLRSKHQTELFRFDLPIVTSNQSGSTRTGFGDFYVQGLFAVGRRPKYGFVWGGGARLIFPTASYREMGKGKYTIAPGIGAEYDAKRYSASLLLLDFLSYAGESDRSDIRELSIRPTFEYLLAPRWSLAWDPDIRLNWQNGQWWVPFTFEINNRVSKRFGIGLDSTFPLAGVKRVESKLVLKLRFYLN